MSKTLKSILVVFILVIIMMGKVNFCAISNPSPGEPNETDTMVIGSDSNYITKVTKNFWFNFSFVVQILAVAAVVFAGVRYMFASAEAKADIKQQTMILIFGAVLVFGAVTVASLINTAVTSAL